MRRGQAQLAPFGGCSRVADWRGFLSVFVLAQLSLQAVVGLSFEIQSTHVDWRSQS